MPTNVLALENGATSRSGARRGRCKIRQMSQIPEVRWKSGTTRVQGETAPQARGVGVSFLQLSAEREAKSFQSTDPTSR